MIVVQDRAEPSTAPLRQSLRRRMARAQRHRLLQGYPMAPLLSEVPPGFDPFRGLELDDDRPLLVGVLPHTFCNPRVEGCGFCTFPHEKFEQAAMRRAVDHVEQEIRQTAARVPSLRRRRVEAVYFGGGTANLTPPEELERLCAALESSLDAGGAEVTLEGVPRYFLLRNEALLDVLGAMKVRHRRLSMGVQTFDPEWIRRMGRDAFGDRAVIQTAVESAHRRGFTASADLLFNLPGASLQRALDDVRAACDIGFDQICVYNLVLTADLDTEWARDTSLVSRMADPEGACATWLAVRRTLLDSGYVQTTLTNFERADVAGTARRFCYERASFEPHTYDAIGFGPGGISTFAGRGRDSRREVAKWMNEGTSEAYRLRIAEHGSAAARHFSYSNIDRWLLHLTRGLAKLAIEGTAFEALLGTGPHATFRERLGVLEEAGLLRHREKEMSLTPRGMFFADAVTGFLAEERVRELRPGQELAPVRGHMG